MIGLNMEWDKKEIEIFKNTQNQIKAFDNKASILISAFSIVFTIYSLLIGINAKSIFENKNMSYNITLFCFLGMSILTCLLAIFFFIMVIFPRKANKSHIKSSMYYWDAAYFNENELRKNIKNCDLVNQISINSKICKMKHKFLHIGFICLVPFSISALGTIIMLFL